MKLLLDQNISFRLVNRINNYYPDSAQVKHLNLENSSDLEIWNFAKENKFSILTFDSDFFDFANIFGHPPKIIWIRGGNASTHTIEKILKERFEIIQDFVVNNEELSCLTLR